MKEHWHEVAERMKFDEGASMSQIVDAIAPLMPEIDKHRVYERARGYLRHSPRYRKVEQEDFHRSTPVVGLDVKENSNGRHCENDEEN